MEYENYDDGAGQYWEKRDISISITCQDTLEGGFDGERRRFSLYFVILLDG